MYIFTDIVSAYISCLIQHTQGCPVLSCFVLSCPVLSCPILSCPVLSCPVLSCPVLFCPVLSCPFLSCPVLSCLILSCPDLSCLVLTYPVLSFLVLSCLVPPVQSYLVLSCPVPSHCTPWRCIGEWRYTSIHSKTLYYRRWVQASRHDQFTTLKNSTVSIKQDIFKATWPVWTFREGEKRTSFAIRITIPRFSCSEPSLCTEWAVPASEKSVV